MKTAIAPVLKHQACHASQAPTALLSCEITNRSPSIRFGHKLTQPYCTRRSESGSGLNRSRARRARSQSAINIGLLLPVSILISIKTNP